MWMALNLAGIAFLAVWRLTSLWGSPQARSVMGADGKLIENVFFETLEVLAASPESAWIVPP